MPSISIIIPVYNSAFFLKECLDSLLHQTFSDWEAILVDDGSEDASPDICADYAQKDKRFRTFTMEKNSGPVLARSFGLQQARGEYIAYLDSDDMVAEDFYEYLLMLMKKYSADFSMVQRQLFQDRKDLHGDTDETGITVKTQEEFAREYFKIGTNETVFFLTDKLFKKELAERIDVPANISIGEDAVAICQVLLASSTIVCSGRELYYYRLNPNGITGAGFSHRDFQLIQVWDTVKDLVKDTDGKYYEYADLNRKRTAMTLLFRMHRAGMSDRFPEEEQKLREELKKNGKTLLRSPIPVMRKLVILGYLTAYPLMKSVFRVYGKVKR